MTHPIITPEELAENLLDDAQEFDGYHYNYDYLRMIERITQYTAAIRQAALDEAHKAVSVMENNDTDWDNSFWNQSVQMCAMKIQNLKSQPAEKGE